MKNLCAGWLVASMLACGSTQERPPDVIVGERDRRDAGASDAGALHAGEEHATGARWEDRGDPCTAFDPGAVAIWGIRPLQHTLAPERTEYPILIPGPDYVRKCYDFEIAHDPRLRADGSLVYHADWDVLPRTGLRIWVGDDYDPKTRERVRQVDLEVPTPGCDPETTLGVLDYVVQPGSGDIFYSCRHVCESPACPGPVYYDTRGREVSDRPLFALTAGGAQLVSCLDDCGSGRYGVRRSADGPLSPADISLRSVHRAPTTLRAHGEGFWFVRYKDDGLHYYDAERWFLAPNGEVTSEGYYDSGELREIRSIALDAHGQLYELQHSAEDRNEQQVVRYTLGGERGEVVFRESEQPEGIELHALQLVTGP